MPETTTTSHTALIDGLLTMLGDRARTADETYPPLEVPIIRGEEDDGSSSPIAVVTIPGLKEVLSEWLVTVEAELSADAAPIDLSEEHELEQELWAARHAEDLKTIQHQAERLREVETANAQLKKARRTALLALQGVKLDG